MTTERVNLAAHVAKVLGVDESQLSALVRDVPTFVDADSLPEEIKAAWPHLTADARLVSCLLAKERAEEDASRWDHYDDV